MLILALLVASSTQTFARCEAERPPGSRCEWRRGTLSANNGAYSSRIGFSRGHPQVVAVQQPGVIEANEYAPPRSEAILVRSPNMWEAVGDYRICAVAPSFLTGYLRENHLTPACIAGERNVRPHRR